VLAVLVSVRKVLLVKSGDDCQPVVVSQAPCVGACAVIGELCTGLAEAVFV
jgi:hypothetical protein